MFYVKQCSEYCVRNIAGFRHFCKCKRRKKLKLQDFNYIIVVPQLPLLVLLLAVRG